MDVNVTIKNYRCFSDENPVRIEFRRGITAIIGPNNSGKSSLLRIFHEVREIFDCMRTTNTSFQSAILNHHAGFSIKSVLDPEEIFCNKNNRDISIEVEFLESNKENLDNSKKEIYPDSLFIYIKRAQSTEWSVGLKINGKIKRFEDSKLKIHGDIFLEKNTPVIYVGHIKEFGEQIYSSIYVGPYRNTINIGGNVDYYDLKVGQNFIKEWGSLKTGRSKKHSRLINSVSENIKNIFSFESLEINASSDGIGFQVALDGEVYNLNELGAGLSQFIIVLATAAMKDPAYIFIDEPELNLHPSLQLSFLTALASYARRGVFFATHSIGLARSAAETIYTVQKNKGGLSVVRIMETNPELPELLGELSFSSYKELGFDKVLLVEGVTEVKAIQQLLRKFGKDQEFLLLHLGSSAFINHDRLHELEEIKRISPHIYAVIDSEIEIEGGKLSKERQKFTEICNKLEISLHVLERRALENYWTDRAIKLALGKAHKELAKYEKMGATNQGWSKSDNWRIAREMTRDELSLTDLGEFLSKIVGKSKNQAS